MQHITRCNSNTRDKQQCLPFLHTDTHVDLMTYEKGQKCENNGIVPFVIFTSTLNSNQLTHQPYCSYICWYEATKKKKKSGKRRKKKKVDATKCQLWLSHYAAILTIICFAKIPTKTTIKDFFFFFLLSMPYSPDDCQFQFAIMRLCYMMLVTLTYTAAGSLLL